MGLSLDMWETENACDWLHEKLSNESEERLIKIAVVLYGVWFARNKKIFEEKALTPAGVMSWSRKQVEEWREANKNSSIIFVGDTIPCTLNSFLDFTSPPSSLLETLLSDLLMN
ncbi:hypothetical protein ACET3Z_000583 [Daucus carota]